MTERLMRTPSWLLPPVRATWPTEPAGSAELRVRLALPAHWSHVPELRHVANEAEQIYQGELPNECLSIASIARADPDANIRTWVDATLALTGVPALALWSEPDARPELLDWRYLGCPSELIARLALDEAHCYVGFAVIPGQPASGARLYMLLARRDEQAWKVFLSLCSACPPGTDEATIEVNDHSRAAATFGSLELG